MRAAAVAVPQHCPSKDLMHLLYLTTDYPWPSKSGGAVRTQSQLRIVSSLPEVRSITLLAIAEEPVAEADQRGLEDAIPKVRVLPPVFHPIHLFDYKRYVPRVVALRLFRGIAYISGKWESGPLRKTLRRELTRTPYDVVYVDHLAMAHYLSDIEKVAPSARIVLDEHNVESDFFLQFAAERSGLTKRIVLAEYAISAAFERDAVRRADAVVAISNDDAKRFEALTGVRPHMVPMVLPFVRRARPRPATPNFCYIGNLRWRPNLAGLDWFCNEVWPKIRAAIPDATFEIAGIGLKTDAAGALVVPDAWRVPGVTTVGFLDDLEPLYDRSLALMAPVFGGSGVRMKMLEGFRAGVPVVTTPDGAFGLPVADGREAFVAADAQAFAERAEQLFRDEALRARVRDGGFTYLEDHHSLRAAAQVMRRVLGLPHAA